MGKPKEGKQGKKKGVPKLKKRRTRIKVNKREFVIAHRTKKGWRSRTVHRIDVTPRTKAHETLFEILPTFGTDGTLDGGSRAFKIAGKKSFHTEAEELAQRLYTRENESPNAK